MIGKLPLLNRAGDAIARAMATGWVPEVYRSSNGSGEQENARYLEKYRGVIPHL